MAFRSAALLLLLALACQARSYKHFRRLFDSSEEDIHGRYADKIDTGDQCANKIATGKYSNQVNQTGWGILEVETYPEFTEEVQAYAAGVVEGSLTKLQIYYHFRNTVEGMCAGNNRDYCARLYRYLRANLDWVKSQVAGDLFDLSHLLKKPKQVTEDPHPDHCTGLVKLTADLKDLLISHVSMSGYNTMNRLLKLYKFAYGKDVPGNTYSFSSYAGAIVSQDDYTLINSGLATIETTISIFNETLYTDKFMKPQGQLACWVRATVSNQISKSGKDWVATFARYNSGTYNNQWTVLNYNQFTPGKPLPNSDVLWVLEQTPGYTESRDLTWFLRKYNYWPSYNIPYQTKVSEVSGFAEKGSQLDWWRWGYAPRAKIIDRDHRKITDIQSLFKVMRHNDYTHEEFSKCTCHPPYTAEAALSSRGDLNPVNGTYVIPGMGHRNHGSLDYKGTNYEYFQKLQIHAIGGPTYDPLPPFSWDTTNIVAPHYGQPTLWKFQPFVTEWETKVNVELTKPVSDEFSSEESDELESIF